MTCTLSYNKRIIHLLEVDNLKHTRQALFFHPPKKNTRFIKVVVLAVKERDTYCDGVRVWSEQSDYNLPSAGSFNIISSNMRAASASICRRSSCFARFSAFLICLCGSFWIGQISEES